MKRNLNFEGRNWCGLWRGAFRETPARGRQSHTRPLPSQPAKLHTHTSLVARRRWKPPHNGAKLIFFRFSLLNYPRLVVGEEGKKLLKVNKARAKRKAERESDVGDYFPIPLEAQWKVARLLCAPHQIIAFSRGPQDVSSSSLAHTTGSTHISHSLACLLVVFFLFFRFLFCFFSLAINSTCVWICIALSAFSTFSRLEGFSEMEIHFSPLHPATSRGTLTDFHSHYVVTFASGSSHWFVEFPFSSSRKGWKIFAFRCFRKTPPRETTMALGQQINLRFRMVTSARRSVRHFYVNPIRRSQRKTTHNTRRWNTPWGWRRRKKRRNGKSWRKKMRFSFSLNSSW